MDFYATRNSCLVGTLSITVVPMLCRRLALAARTRKMSGYQQSCCRHVLLCVSAFRLPYCTFYCH
ncbi:hypothetical protein CONLIGDRAFT_108627 [Coniochaeta ligniaria NRRL 30616]|uniref:Uncharacterized protein n=1 Tax=Coniochaeta ligniaria NRRL 30616 TaxID=1408157 RepID=A0A1J7IAI6_9PEZI|nr:hypothetical protein CONLIGDRAFT_108627 [Coniochaeta ligniaria NRRL 30616]